MAMIIFQLYAVATLIVGYLITIGYSEPYTDWYSLGAHGLPLNVVGYGVDKFLQKIQVDKRDVSVFAPGSEKAEHWAKRTAPGGSISYLSAASLKPRDHAEVLPYVVPQLEVEGNEDIVPVLRSYVEDMADRDDRFTIKPSNLESGDIGSVWLKRKHKWQMVGEFAHVHQDGSSHFILSVPDAREVLEKGWGERHGMAGRMTPLTYMFVYAPRDEEELKEWKKIAKASAAFITAE